MAIPLFVVPLRTVLIPLQKRTTACPFHPHCPTPVNQPPTQLVAWIILCSSAPLIRRLMLRRCDGLLLASGTESCKHRGKRSSTTAGLPAGCGDSDETPKVVSFSAASSNLFFFPLSLSVSLGLGLFCCLQFKGNSDKVVTQANGQGATKGMISHDFTCVFHTALEPPCPCMWCTAFHKFEVCTPLRPGNTDNDSSKTP